MPIAYKSGDWNDPKVWQPDKVLSGTVDKPNQARCSKCNKLLATSTSKFARVKSNEGMCIQCLRCKTMNNFTLSDGFFDTYRNNPKVK